MGAHLGVGEPQLVMHVDRQVGVMDEGRHAAQHLAHRLHAFCADSVQVAQQVVSLLNPLLHTCACRMCLCAGWPV